MDYALIKNGLVENIIVADESFIALISPEWDHIEPLDQEAEKVAGPGWSWDGVKFSPPAAPPVVQVPSLTLSLTYAGNPWVQVGSDFTVQAALHNPDGSLAPENELFLVPIERSDAPGMAAMVKGVQFSGGRATVSITFPASGYYQITESGINSRLQDLHIALSTPFQVTVFD